MRSRRLLLVVPLAFAAVVAAASPAVAHAGVVASSPADGAFLPTAPKEIILKFSERVEVSTAAVNIETITQRLIQNVRPTRWRSDPTALVVPVTKKLSGSYVLFWRATGEDSHVVSGAFSFAVQTKGSASASPKIVNAALFDRSATKPFVLGALTAARGVTFGALSVLIGGVILLLFVWPQGAKLRRTRWLLWAALGAASLATVVSANVSFAAATGRGLFSALSPAHTVDSLSTHFGWISLVRFALLGLAALLLFDLDTGVSARSLSWLVPAALVGAGLVRTPGLVDHGATASPLESVAYFVHMGAMAVWVGGLVMIALVVLPTRRSIDGVGALLARFSGVATIAFGLVVASGIVLASPLLEHWSSVSSSDYAELFRLKVMLVIGGLALAWRVRSWLRTSPGLPTAGVRVLASEVAVVVGVIAVTAVLVGRSEPVESPTTQPISINEKGPVGESSPY